MKSLLFLDFYQGKKKGLTWLPRGGSDGKAVYRISTWKNLLWSIFIIPRTLSPFLHAVLLILLQASFRSSEKPKMTTTLAIRVRQPSLLARKGLVGLSGLIYWLIKQPQPATQRRLGLEMNLHSGGSSSMAFIGFVWGVHPSVSVSISVTNGEWWNFRNLEFLDWIVCYLLLVLQANITHILIVSLWAN